MKTTYSNTDQVYDRIKTPVRNQDATEPAEVPVHNRNMKYERTGIIDLINSSVLESRIQRLICVTKPYYAIKNFQEVGGILQGEIDVEYLSSGESTILSGAEAGRHLAILGSCALALQNLLDEKHYYLAKTAYLERGDNLSEVIQREIGQDRRLTVEARVLDFDLKKKYAAAETRILTKSGVVIFKLNVTYQVLRATLFQKLFTNYFSGKPASGIKNPYANGVDINNIVYANRRLMGDLGLVRPEQCLGHFDHYPALPIAVLCSALSKLGAMHLKKIVNDESLKYTIKKAYMHASNLAFAGEHVLINSNFLYESNGEYVFEVKATNKEGKDFGGIKIAFELLSI